MLDAFLGSADRPDGVYEFVGGKYIKVEEGIDGDKLRFFTKEDADVSIKRDEGGLVIEAYDTEHGIQFWLTADQVALLRKFLDAQEA